MKKTCKTATSQPFKTWDQLKKERARFRHDHPYIYWYQENIYYPVIRTWNQVKDIPKEIKWFIQRGRRGWADCDAWGWCDYNARVTADVLKYLSKVAHSHPPNISFEDWKTELVRMSIRFEVLSNCETDSTATKSYQKYINDTFKLYSKWFLHIWD